MFARVFKWIYRKIYYWAVRRKNAQKYEMMEKEMEDVDVLEDVEEVKLKTIPMSHFNIFPGAGALHRLHLGDVGLPHAGHGHVCRVGRMELSGFSLLLCHLSS